MFIFWPDHLETEAGRARPTIVSEVTINCKKILRRAAAARRRRSLRSRRRAGSLAPVLGTATARVLLSGLALHDGGGRESRAAQESRRRQPAHAAVGNGHRD